MKIPYVIYFRKIMATGGYEVKLVEGLPQDLYCIVCMNLLKDAVQMQCGHVLCRACLEKLQEYSKSR